MGFRILLVDCDAQHRQVMQHFISRTHPGVQLDIHDPCAEGLLPATHDWTPCHLLILDNILGKHDGLGWIEEVRDQPGFPPYIFLSSIKNPGAASSTQLVINAVKLGAENFLFKKGLKAKQLKELITGILRKAGYDPEAVIEEQARKTGRQRDEVTREMQLTVNNTVVEIELAMAMLQGHEEWPFTMPDILAGKARLGSYKVTSYMGKDADSSTFRAINTSNGEKVLLKLINQPVDPSSTEFTQCQADLKKALQWKHENVIRLIEVIQEDQRLILVQEFLQGESLSRVLARKGVTEEQATRYITSILSGMQFLHEQGMVAGDVTTGNLRFRDDETIVLSNIGLSGKLHKLGSVVDESTITKNPVYKSPEAIQRLSIDARSDLYLAGVIAHEMLAGHPPYYRGSVKDILYEHIQKPYPGLPDREHPMNEVIGALLEKTPGKRIQTAAEAIRLIHQSYDKLHQVRQSG